MAVSADGLASVTVPVGSSAELEITAIDPTDLPATANGLPVLSGYTITNPAALAAAGLRVAQPLLLFPQNAWADVVVPIDPMDVVQDGFFFDPNLSLVTPNPAFPGGIKNLLNQQTVVNGGVVQGGQIGWGQSTPTKHVFLTQDLGGISPTPGFNADIAFEVDSVTGSLTVIIDGAFTGAGTSPGVTASLFSRDPSSGFAVVSETKFGVAPSGGFGYSLAGDCDDMGVGETLFIDVTVTEPEEKRGPVLDGHLLPRHTLRTGFPAGDVCDPAGGGPCEDGPNHACLGSGGQFTLSASNNGNPVPVGAPTRAGGVDVVALGESGNSQALFWSNDNLGFNVLGSGSVGEPGLTELFFESAEPWFDVQALEELLALFPEGIYQFDGMGQANRGSLIGDPAGDGGTSITGGFIDNLFALARGPVADV